MLEGGFFSDAAWHAVSGVGDEYGDAGDGDGDAGNVVVVIKVDSLFINWTQSILAHTTSLRVFSQEERVSIIEELVLIILYKSIQNHQATFSQDLVWSVD